MPEGIFGLLQDDIHRFAVEIAVENDGMNVALPTNRRSVTEPLRYSPDSGEQIFLRLFLRLKSFKLTQRDCCEHRACPSAEIFRGKFRSGGLMKVVVHVIRFHVL
jgi:hypothetical protein